MSDQLNAGSTFEPVKLGEVRPSQLIHTYGTGSVLELPNFSVIVPGLDGTIHQGDPWHTKRRDTIVYEERLLELVQDVLGPAVTNLRAPVRMEPPPGRHGDRAMGRHRYVVAAVPAMDAMPGMQHPEPIRLGQVPARSPEHVPPARSPLRPR